MDPVVSQPLNIALGEFMVRSAPGEPYYSTQFFHVGEEFLAVAIPIDRIELFEKVKETPMARFMEALEGKVWIHEALGIENAGAIVWIQRLPVRNGIPTALARVSELQSFSAPARAEIPAPETPQEPAVSAETPAKKSKSKGD